MHYTLKCKFVEAMDKYVAQFIYGTKTRKLPKELYSLVKLLEWEDSCDGVYIPCNYDKYL